MRADYGKTGAGLVLTHQREQPIKCKGGCQKRRDLNIDLLVVIKRKFLRILNYLQSFQEHVVTFSSVITLSERKKHWSCSWIYLNIFLSIVYFSWCTARYTVWQTIVPCNITRSTKSRGAQRAPELALSSTEPSLQENLIFPALMLH